MKISSRTKQILKNFASINQNVLLSQGEKIRSLAPSKTVYAEAVVEESFPCEFGIYDLNEFLGVLNIFSDPELHFEKNFVKISQGKNSVTYLPCDPTVLVIPKKDLVLKDPATSFKLASDDLNQVLKAAAVLKSPFITFRGDGNEIKMIAHDKANPNTNNFDVQVSDSEVKFEYHVKTEFIAKLLGEDYNVRIQSEKKAVVFEGDNKTYMIAAESDSSI